MRPSVHPTGDNAARARLGQGPRSVLTRHLVRLPPRLKRLGVPLAIVGFWVLTGGLESVREMAVGALQGSPGTLGQVLSVHFPWWLLWAAGTFVVLGLARRYPLEVEPRSRWVAVHILASVGTALVHVMIVGFFLYYTMPRGAGTIAEPTLWPQIRSWMGASLPLNVVVYWLVLGAHHGFLYHRRYLEGRLREAEALERAAKLETQATEAKLQALRMELNPHFLFNALNSVTALVEEDRTTEAERMLHRLSHLMRVTLRRGRRRHVDLAQELEFIERYLDIERIRFGEWLTVEVAVDDIIRDAMVPPMVLQPLVENAVRYGASRTRGPSSIRIDGAAENGRIRLTVRDDGPGPPTPLQEGTGLRNLRERLTLYGDDASLSVRRNRPYGCVAEVQFPYRRFSYRRVPDPQ